MVIVRVSPELLSELLFKGLDVEIRDARMTISGNLEFSIRGDDVPDCVVANITMLVTQEKGCDRWTRVEIVADRGVGSTRAPPGLGYSPRPPYGSAPSNPPNMGTAGVKPSNS